jgi:RimJ/RimL family protein N-acetyltransferase
MLTLHRFAEIDPATWLTLLNDRDVHRHMPLAGDATWTEAMAAEWAASKDGQWAANGYGPWALRLDGEFAGWGGFQREGTEADFGLVLLPAFWGHGAAIFREILARGRELPLGPVSILLPPSRVRMKGLVRLGFEPAGELSYDGHRFLKFRLRDA